MPNKSTDEKIEELALMVGHGLNELRDKIDAGFAAVEQRLERIEFHVSGQDRRITLLEDRVRQLATKIGLSFN
jgi:hypothetical protein